MIKVLFSLSLWVFILGCASGYIKDYTPKSSEEEAIKTVLIAFETGWNMQEEETILSLLDEDFVVWVWSGSTRRLVFTKATFGFRLWITFVRWRYLSLGMPEIWIKGAEATAHVAMSVDGRGARSTFRLVNRGGTWLILEWEF
jgi:hypothetical protein